VKLCTRKHDKAQEGPIKQWIYKGGLHIEHAIYGLYSECCAYSSTSRSRIRTDENYNIEANATGTLARTSGACMSRPQREIRICQNLWALPRCSHSIGSIHQLE